MPNKSCAVEGCGKPHKAKGLCSTHYVYWKNHGVAQYIPVVVMKTPISCSVPGCERPKEARGWCSMHWKRWRAHGDPVQLKFAPGALCSVEGCERSLKALGFCQLHYHRTRRTGGTQIEGPSSSDKQDFIASAIAHSGDNCLPWPFAISPEGYGRINNEYVHRIVCEGVDGPPPTPDHEASHSCGNGHLACISGGHLRWATRLENANDMVAHGTSTKGVKNARAKLTNHQVRQIRSLATSGTRHEIGQMFGVSGACITAILTGRTWSWLK